MISAITTCHSFASDAYASIILAAVSILTPILFLFYDFMTHGTFLIVELIQISYHKQVFQSLRHLYINRCSGFSISLCGLINMDH